MGEILRKALRFLTCLEKNLMVPEFVPSLREKIYEGKRASRQ